MNKSRPKPTYLLVPRKLIITWLVSSTVLFIMVLASFQYANYTDRRSNQRWCGLIEVFTESYNDTPPTTTLDKTVAAEMEKLEKNFSCKIK